MGLHCPVQMLAAPAQQQRVLLLPALPFSVTRMQLGHQT